MRLLKSYSKTPRNSTSVGKVVKGCKSLKLGLTIIDCFILLAHTLAGQVIQLNVLQM